VTFLRCVIEDARVDNSVASMHPEGIYLSNVKGILISQCTIDNNGRVSSDRTGRDIFSHNVYIQSDCGPAVVWGNVITNGGSHGIQMRSGGILAYNYFGGNAIAAFVDGPGGAQYKNVVEDAQDISTTLPRGFGLSMSASYRSSISQIMEDNIIVNSVGGQPQGITIDEQVPDYGIQSALIRHNTVVGAGVFNFNSSKNLSPANGLISNSNNILAPNSGLVYSAPAFRSWGWYAADQNVLSTTALPNRVAMIRNPYQSWSGWTAITGTEANSITTASTFNDASASLGSYAGSLGLSASSSDFINLMRNRPESTWSSQYDMTNLYQYFAWAYTPTNLPALGTGKFDYYGAVDYRTSSSSAASASTSLGSSIGLRPFPTFGGQAVHESTEVGTIVELDSNSLVSSQSQTVQLAAVDALIDDTNDEKSSSAFEVQDLVPVLILVLQRKRGVLIKFDPLRSVHEAKYS